MMLLIDIGNSRIKLGWLDRNSGAREPQALAAAHDDWESIPAWLHTLPRTPVCAIGSNVADAQLAQRLHGLLGLPTHWVNGSTRAGNVHNGYANPAQLGADRWAALIGLTARATHLAHRPLLLANYGTATTIDTLSPQGDDGRRVFIGGLILPGAHLMRAALAQHTARLPLAHGVVTDFPTNTDQAIMSGVSAAQAGAVAQQWQRTQARFGRDPALYVSGGDWCLVSNAVQAAMRQVQNDLVAAEPATVVSPVLDGLAHLGKTL